MFSASVVSLQQIDQQVTNSSIQTSAKRVNCEISKVVVLQIRDELLPT